MIGPAEIEEMLAEYAERASPVKGSAEPRSPTWPVTQPSKPSVRSPPVPAKPAKPSER